MKENLGRESTSLRVFHLLSLSKRTQKDQAQSVLKEKEENPGVLEKNLNFIMTFHANKKWNLDQPLAIR